MHNNVHILPFYIFGTILISAFALAVLGSLIIQKQRQVKNRLARQQLAFDYEQSLLNTKIEVREATLNMLAQELHDNITQAITGCYLEVNAAAAHIRSPEGKEIADNAKEHLMNVIRDVRLLSHSLSTGMVEHKDLYDAIQAELSRIQAFTSIDCQLASNTLVELQPHQRLLLFRVVQEALQNTLKHAAARNIRISMDDDGRSYYLAIVDDGIGFDLSAAAASHTYGLYNIRERVEKLQGRITVLSQPGEGTRIELQIPILP